MELTSDVIKLWGPLSLGWVLALYLLKFVLDRYKDDIDSRIKLAMSLDNLSRVIERCGLKNV